MSQIFSLNGAAFTHGIQADWVDQPDGDYLAGPRARRRWLQHIWAAAVMPAGEFNTLAQAEGGLVSLTTTNLSDRNGAFVTYYGAELRSVSGVHAGPNMEQVRAEFWIRT